MKKLITLFLVTASLSLATQAQEFGVKLGGNYSFAKNDTNEANNVLSTNEKPFLSYNIGVYGQINFAGFFFRPEILISEEGTKTAIDFSDQDIKSSVAAISILQGTGKTPTPDQVAAYLNANGQTPQFEGTVNALTPAFEKAEGTYATKIIYANIPLLFGKTFLAKKIGVYTGFNLKVAIGGDNEVPNSIDQNARRLATSIPIGAYVKLGKIGIDVRYNIMLSDARDDLARISPVTLQNPANGSNLPAAQLDGETGLPLAPSDVAAGKSKDPNKTKINTLQLSISYQLFGKK